MLDEWPLIGKVLKQNVLLDYLMKVRSKLIFHKNKSISNIVKRCDHQTLCANIAKAEKDHHDHKGHDDHQKENDTLREAQRKSKAQLQKMDEKLK